MFYDWYFSYKNQRKQERNNETAEDNNQTALLITTIDYRVLFIDEWLVAIGIGVSWLVADFWSILWRCSLSKNLTMAMLRYDRYRSVIQRFRCSYNDIVVSTQWDIYISIENRNMDADCWVIVNDISLSSMMKYCIYVAMLRIRFEHLFNPLTIRKRHE